MQPRLTRLTTLFQANPIYFITFCTFDRRPLLASAAVHQSFHKFCLAALAINLCVGRYVIMPNHIHLFVQLDAARPVSAWVKSLKNSLSKTLRQSGHIAPHWQKDFFDHVLRSGESYEAKWNYVRQNPVRHGLVSVSTEWPYQGKVGALDFR